MPRIYKDWLDAYMEYGNNTEASSLFRKWVGVSTIASALRRKVHLEWHARIFPNLYVVLVGPAGGRKGTAMNLSLPMLETLQIKMAAEAITREALIRELSEATESYTNADGEEFHHCSLTVSAQELAVFLGQNNLQLLSDLTDWYDCKNIWTYRTKHVGTDTVEGVWVNLIGATTPSILQNSLPQDAIGGGLTSRIIFVYSPGKGKLVPIPFITQDCIDMQTNLTRDLEEIGLMQGAFKVDKPMLDYYVEWYVKHEKNPPFQQEIFAGYNERKATHALKLSMILSASRSDEMVVTLKDFERALNMLSEAETVMPKVFSGYGRRDNADMIPQVVNVIMGAKVISYSELTRRFLTELRSADLDEIVTQLCRIGFCKQTHHENGDITLEYNKEYRD